MVAAWLEKDHDKARAVLGEAVLEHLGSAAGDRDSTDVHATNNPKVNEHSKEKVKLLKKLRSVITSEIRGSLSVADVVQGDFQRPKPSAAATASIEYMQGCAMEYYNQFLVRILFDFEAVVDRHLFAVFDDATRFEMELLVRLGFSVANQGETRLIFYLTRLQLATCTVMHDHRASFHVPSQDSQCSAALACRSQKPSMRRALPSQRSSGKQCRISVTRLTKRSRDFTAN